MQYVKVKVELNSREEPEEWECFREFLFHGVTALAEPENNDEQSNEKEHPNYWFTLELHVQRHYVFVVRCIQHLKLRLASSWIGWRLCLISGVVCTLILGIGFLGRGVVVRRSADCG